MTVIPYSPTKRWNFSGEIFLEHSDHIPLLSTMVLCCQFVALLESALENLLLYPDSGISMDEEIGLGNMIWSYNRAEL